MPKHGFLTPKAISKCMKSKGLQKLRFFCQMCEKQCRDQNGFQCHSNSESHQRQLLLFAEDPHRFVNQFSKEFFDQFVILLKRRFGSRRVAANQVYQEYIADNGHVHMNSTKWETLTDFVKWLGREGYCLVEDTETGWYISHIDRDAATIRRQKSQKKKSDSEGMVELLKTQREGLNVQSQPQTFYTELKADREKKVSFSIKCVKQTISGTSSALKTKIPKDRKRTSVSEERMMCEKRRRKNFS